MFTLKVIVVADPQLVAVAREWNATVNRWLDRDESAEVATLLYDAMKGHKANIDDNFIRSLNLRSS